MVVAFLVFSQPPSGARDLCYHLYTLVPIHISLPAQKTINNKLISITNCYLNVKYLINMLDGYLNFPNNHMSLVENIFNLVFITPSLLKLVS